MIAKDAPAFPWLSRIVANTASAAVLASVAARSSLSADFLATSIASAAASTFCFVVVSQFASASTVPLSWAIAFACSSAFCLALKAKPLSLFAF
ncbi:MAG: hypothetical protein ABMA15_14465 [Vicinamibacterales bacterium]